MPDLWTTRIERAADAEAVRSIHLAAFETAQEADLVDALRGDPPLAAGTVTPRGDGR